MKFKKFLYFISVFLVSIFVLEILLRIIPVEQRIIQSITEQGDFNILCVGDSITYGPGCEEKFSFPKILEKKLNNSFKDKKIKVYNLGKPSLNSNDAYFELIKYFKVYSPKILNLMIGACNTETDLYFSDSNIELQKSFFSKTFGKLKIWNVINAFYINIYGFSAFSNNTEVYNNNLIKNTKDFKFPDISEHKKQLLNNKVVDMKNFKNKNKGWDFYFKNNYEKAEDFFIRNLNDIENVYGIVLLYGDLGKFTKALEIIDRNLKNNLENPILNTFAAVIYGEQGNFKKSFEFLNKGLSLSPSDVSIITFYAYIANLAENYEKAMEYINIALEIDDTYGDAYNVAGFISQNMGQNEKSAEFYLKGIAKDPDNFINYRDLGYYYINLENYSMANKWFEKAIKLNPYDYDSYKGCVISLLDSTDNEDLIKSQEYFKKSNDLNPLINSINEKLDYDLNRIYELCRKNNVKLFLMNYPQADNIVMRRFSERENIPYIDIYREFSKKVGFADKFPNKYFITGKVCSAEGNGLIAEKIYEKLLENKALSFEGKK
ncbi:MAG: tetratricopeptide repeat protein [Candidatus Muirbacterium halophilum]|nr:tetratricopeptide repeat protein [Candidatus Muirbacterium halophilum]